MSQAESSRPGGTPRRLEHARQVEARKVARRSFLRASSFAGILLFTGSLTAGFLAFFNKRNPVGFGAPVTVSAAQIPDAGGEPARISEGKFWLVNLQGTQGDVLGAGGTGGLLALYWKCPHLGCTVPWRADFAGAQVNFPGVTGWFRCPCHGSTYSRAGVRVFGPAPRSMDTFLITVNGDGSLTVNTRAITSGAASPANPLRAISYS
jgi:cytochrome b6-f complex iron-sulfur subunit